MKKILLFCLLFCAIHFVKAQTLDCFFTPFINNNYELQNQGDTIFKVCYNNKGYFNVGNDDSIEDGTLITYNFILPNNTETSFSQVHPYTVSLSFSYPGFYQVTTSTGLGPFYIEVIDAYDLPEVTGSDYGCGEHEFTISNYDESKNYYWSTNNTGDVTETSPTTAIVDWSGLNNAELYLTLSDSYGQCPTTLTKDMYDCCEVNEQTDYILEDEDNIFDLLEQSGETTLTDKEIVINGKFDCNQFDLTLYNCNVRIAAFGKIIQNNYPGNKLEAHFTSFESCVDTMWTGIEVKSGDVILENCSIKDALIGVNVKRSGDNPYIYLNKNTLTTNYIDFKAVWFIDPESKILNSNYLLDFDDYQPLPFKYPHLGRFHTRHNVHIENVPFITIGEENNGNTFYAEYNIVALHSSLDVIGNNIYWGGTSNDYFESLPFHSSIYARSTTNSNHHINIIKNDIANQSNINLKYINAKVESNTTNYFTYYFLRSSFMQNKSIEILNNRILTTNYLPSIEVFAKGNGNVNIHHNFIRNLEDWSIKISNGIDGETNVENNCTRSIKGILLSNVYPNSKIHKNVIGSLLTGVSIINSPETQVANNFVHGDGTFPNDPIVSENGIHSTSSPLSFFVQNEITFFKTSLEFSGPSFDSQIRNNIFYKGHKGIKFTNDAFVGPQGSPSDPSDNVWKNNTLTSTDWENHLIAEGANGSLSPFYHRTSTDFIPFLNGSGPNAVPIFPAFTTTPYQEPIIPTYFDMCVPILNPPTFRSAPNNSTTFDFISQSPYESANDYLHQQKLYEYLRLNPELTESSSVLQAYLEEEKMLNIKEIYEAKELEKNGEYELARQKILAFTDRNAIEKTTQEVYGIYYLELRDSLPFSNLSPQVKSRIDYLARLCPFTHGTAVYTARDIASYMDTAYVNYRNVCEWGTPWIGARQEQEQFSSLYPNPTQGIVHLQHPLASEVVLHDLMGKEQFRQTLSKKENSLNIEHLPRGIYLLSLWHEGQQLQQEKLFKIR